MNSYISMVLQSYEWTTMIFIILIQSENSLGKIIYTLHEEAEKKKFVRKEMAIGGVFFMLSLIIALYRVEAILFDIGINFFTDYKELFLNLKIGGEIGILVVMTVVFITLVFLLNKHYK
jgi:hypothetical protein